MGLTFLKGLSTPNLKHAMYLPSYIFLECEETFDEPTEESHDMNIPDSKSFQ